MSGLGQWRWLQWGHFTVTRFQLALDQKARLQLAHLCTWVYSPVRLADAVTMVMSSPLSW